LEWKKATMDATNSLRKKKAAIKELTWQIISRIQSLIISGLSMPTKKMKMIDNIFREYCSFQNRCTKIVVKKITMKLAIKTIL